MAKNRLSRELWLAAGVQALVEQGPVALKAEPLARRLGTTKGSFYWHFQDVPAFQDALLAQWEQEVAACVQAAQESDMPAVQRLRTLQTAIAETETTGLEPAIRAWARENESVAGAVARIDALRQDHLMTLLSEIGLTNADLSRIIYGALLGMQELSTRDGQDNAEALGTLVDLILALYEGA